MKRLVALFLVITLSRCTERMALSTADAPLLIRTGTSFGMCIGYCQHDYALDGTSITLVQNGTRTQAQHPTKTCRADLSQTDWNALRAAVDFDAFSRQPATLGCPDCADGGAEYIEIQLGDRQHRVTFEYGQTIPGFEPLVTALRSRRAAFSGCP